MTLDNSKPVLFRVSIAASGLGGAAPADGFIDNTIIEKYMAKNTHTGSAAISSMTDGDTIHINGIPVTFTTAGGLNTAGVVTTINAFTDMHHCVASSSSSKLVLTNEDGFEGNSLTVTGSVAVLTELAYVAPVITATPGAAPASLANSEKKARGNCRFRYVNEQLSREATPNFVGAVVKTGGTVDADPTVIAFTVSFSAAQYVYTLDETNNNTVIEGIPAIKRLVARALMIDKFQLFQVFDPSTYNGGGTDSGTITKGARIENIHVGALTTDLPTAEGAVTVTFINTSR